MNERLKDLLCYLFRGDMKASAVEGPRNEIQSDHKHRLMRGGAQSNYLAEREAQFFDEVVFSEKLKLAVGAEVVVLGRERLLNDGSGKHLVIFHSKQNQGNADRARILCDALSYLAGLSNVENPNRDRFSIHFCHLHNPYNAYEALPLIREVVMTAFEDHFGFRLEECDLQISASFPQVRCFGIVRMIVSDAKMQSVACLLESFRARLNGLLVAKGEDPFLVWNLLTISAYSETWVREHGGRQYAFR